VEVRVGVLATLFVMASSAIAGDGHPATCANAASRAGEAVHAGFGPFWKHAYRQAEGSFREAVSVFAACPRQTRREDEATARQLYGGILWHLGKTDAAYVQLRAVRRLNGNLQIVDAATSKSADAFAKGDYRRAYALLRTALSGQGFVGFPAGLSDSGAADAMREALNAGADGHFALALARAEWALKAVPDSQATRMVAGVANLATMHPVRARDLLFDALFGYDANPEGWIFTNLSLTATYVLVALRDERKVSSIAPRGTR
jgi:hypothetical protein